MGGVGAVSAARKRMMANSGKSMRWKVRLNIDHPTSGINVRANIPRLSWEMQTEGGEGPGGGRMRPPLHELLNQRAAIAVWLFFWRDHYGCCYFVAGLQIQ